MALIAELHYEAYFLTVWDLVHFARGRGILCQGRGSAANSAVCFCLGITSVDPERMDVLFERFISRERNEAPDIDVDFEHERREEVLQYLYQKYGRQRAGMTAEVISYRPRSAVRDVAKALGLPQERIERLAKGMEHYRDEGPNFGETALTRGRAKLGPVPFAGLLARVVLKRAWIERSGRQLIELVPQVLGFPRHLSQHTGGMVMTRGPLDELVPIENAAMPEQPSSNGTKTTWTNWACSRSIAWPWACLRRSASASTWCPAPRPATDPGEHPRRMRTCTP